MAIRYHCAMRPLRVFISSVQSEFAHERAVLRDYIGEDPMLRRFFDVFLFEDVPAVDRRPDALYLDEVSGCDIFVGLFGREYGHEDDEGISPTEREFDAAGAGRAHRLVFVKAVANKERHPKVLALIGKAQAGLVRKRFDSVTDLKAALYAALVEFMEQKELLRVGPFEEAAHQGATLDDLDAEWMTLFVRIARRARGFPLAADVAPEALLAHLGVLNDGRLTNAALMLFAKQPQRYLATSEIRCAHFHSVDVRKPIPSFQVYKGTVFRLVDQAVDFVLSKLALSVGTRAESVRVPIAYEIPKEVVTEAIVNAVAHRDYASNGSVQVMLFSDRLEVRNPGGLQPPMTLEKLRVPHDSVPANPRLAEAMYLAEYVERMGTGTLDMIARCVQAGVPAPEFADDGGFVTTIRRPVAAGHACSPEELERRFTQQGQARDKLGTSQTHGAVQPLASTGTIGQRTEGQAGDKQGTSPDAAAASGKDAAMLQACAAQPLPGSDLREAAGYRGRSGDFSRRLEKLLDLGWLQRTVPDKPRSPLQKYRLTDAGRAVLARQRKL